VWLTGSTRRAPISSTAQRRAWRGFLETLVRRYGPGGDFWTDKPYYEPITAWQIWNEPNLKAYWKRPNPKEYAKLLKAAVVLHEAYGSIDMAHHALAAYDSTQGTDLAARYRSEILGATQLAGGQGA
jgi:hypothetical protein